MEDNKPEPKKTRYIAIVVVVIVALFALQSGKHPKTAISTQASSTSQTVVQQPAKSTREMSDEELELLIKNKLKDEVVQLLGKPFDSNETDFFYKELGHDPYSDNDYTQCRVAFGNKDRAQAISCK